MGGISAPRRASAPVIVSALFIILSFTTAAEASSYGQPTTHLHFYFHEVFSSGPNSTVAMLTPARDGVSNGSVFGMMGVVDDMLREGSDPSSRLIGRVQGLSAGTSLSDGALLTALNIRFTDEPYNGSTLQVFGRALLGTVMERPIIGGTGAFRMARGYTLSKKVESPDPSTLLVLEYDAYVWH
jgi:uncharacterized membrane protein